MGLCRYPIHCAMLIINLVAAIAAIILGFFLLVIRHSAFSVVELAEWLDDPSSNLTLTKEGAQDRDKAYVKAQAINIVALILSILCFIFAIFLFKRAFDFAILLFWRKDQLDLYPMLDWYRKCLVREYEHYVGDEDQHLVASSSQVASIAGKSSAKKKSRRKTVSSAKTVPGNPEIDAISVRPTSQEKKMMSLPAKISASKKSRRKKDK